MKHLPKLIAIILLLTSCNSKIVLPTATGTAFEMVVVVDDSIWKSDDGHTLFDFLNTDVPNLPQSEPMFKISRVATRDFDNLLRPARNILIVNVNDKQFTKPAVLFANDRWAQGQAIATLNMPQRTDLSKILEEQGSRIYDFFIRSERKNFQNYLKTSHNHPLEMEVTKRFGVQMMIPQDMCQVQYKDNFMWMSNGSSKGRQDIVIYSLPYKTTEDLEAERIIANRDSVMKQNIPGPDAGSYMGTEKNYCPPSFRHVAVNGAFCAEIHGLWKVMNGSMMGGPFVSHSRVDEINNRIITIEGFVFAPSMGKRNFIRQMEAVLYSAKMPQEINEVIVQKNR